MRVLHISVRADMGGGPKHIQYLLNELSVYSTITNFVACPQEEPFYNVFKDLIGDDKIYSIPHRKLELNSIRYIINCVKINKIGIVHCHGKGASVYGKLLKIFFKKKVGIIYTTHGLQFDNYNFLKNKLNIYYEKLTSKLIDHVIYVSHSESQVAINNGVFKNNSSSVIPNGVPVPDVSIASFEEKNKFLRDFFPQSKNKDIVITISRYDYQKNMQECLAIANKLNHINFLWIGDGPDFEEIQGLIHKMGITNIFQLRKTNQILSFLKMADLYLSTSRWEGMPLALLEAMSLGIPIVATEVVGNADLINDVTGETYKLGKIDDGANKIEKILFKGTNVQKIKEYFIGHYSAKSMCTAVYNVYANV